MSELILKVVRDELPLDPRTTWDTLGTLAIFHRRYCLGDESHRLPKPEYFDSWDEAEEYLYSELDAAVVLPVYMYDHSGVMIQTRPFSCGWDSGQVGFIWVSKEKVRETFQQKRFTKKLRQRVTEALEAEVETYNQYLNGDVWGFKIETEDGQHVDSCWGFFGEDSARKDGEETLAYYEKHPC